MAIFLRGFRTLWAMMGGIGGMRLVMCRSFVRMLLG